MHLIFAVIILGLVGWGAVSFGSHVTSQVAQRGPAGPARVARGAQARGRQARTVVADRTREVWAEAQSADWLERRRAGRERRAARPSAGQRAAAAASATGRGAAATARWATAPLRRPAGAPPAPAAVPGPAPAPGPGPAPPPAGTAPAPARQPAPVPPGRTDPVTASPGASADLFAAVQQLTAHASAGGLQAKYRAVTALAEALDYMQQHVASWAVQLSEPGQGYPATIWEPLTTVAAHLKAGSGAASESSSAICALAAMTVGELAASPVRAPHHDELNKDAA